MKYQNDEPIKDQISDVNSSNLAPYIDRGIDFYEGCDQIEGASGRFGYDATNPIPVNTSVGELFYLQRLRAPSSAPFLFHKIGNVNVSNNSNPVDHYELVAMDGSLRIELYFDYCFFWRSTKTPETLTLFDFKDMDSGLTTLYKYPAFGTTSQLKGFPFSLPSFIRSGDLAKDVPELAEAIAADIEKSLEEFSEQLSQLFPQTTI
jgi:hypothetical protein